MASLSDNPLPNYEISKSHLHAGTTAGLQAAGIPIAAFGFRRGVQQVLSSCFAFSSFAREGLPPSAGVYND